MKRRTILRLMAVALLALPPLASAELVFKVNGAPAPPEVGLMYGDTLELSLELSSGNIEAYAISYELYHHDHEFITDAVEFPADFYFPGLLWVDTPQHIEINASQFFGPPLPGPIVLMQKLYVHQFEPFGTLLTIKSLGGCIVDGETIPADTVLKTVTIIHTHGCPFKAGDFQPDWYVDIHDLSTFASAWLSSPGDDHWNRLCDLSHPSDDIINLLDFAPFAENWLTKPMPW